MDSSSIQADKIAANQIKNLLIVIVYVIFLTFCSNFHCDLLLILVIIISESTDAGTQK